MYDARPVKAGLSGTQILVTDETGASTSTSLDFALQYRCSPAFAKPFLLNGGLLADLRNGKSWADLTEGIDKARPVFFLCERGYRADEAAREARKAGFTRAYSLGGK